MPSVVFRWAGTTTRRTARPCASDASAISKRGSRQAPRAVGSCEPSGPAWARLSLVRSVYFLVSAFTGYEFGLIAIAVGWGVGMAVRWGSNGRGGKGYQVLAVALTYLAIVSTYIPPIVEEILKPEAVEEEAVNAPARDADLAVAEPEEPATMRDVFLGSVFLIALAAAAPFLAGVENIIGLVIIGIGLWEAWKLNRFQELKVTGPHHDLASAAHA